MAFLLNSPGMGMLIIKELAMLKDKENKWPMGIGRLCVVLIMALLLVWFLLPAFQGVVNLGNVAGILLCVLFLWLAGYPGARSCLAGIWSHGAGKVFLSAVSLALGIFLVFGVVMSCLMAAAINRPPQGNGTVVILGCQVKGTQPSLMLTKRLEAAKGYLDQNPGAVCIPSGGKGNGELVSEAQAMKTWLVGHGIDEARIYLEDQSTDTVENIRNSKEIMEREGLPQDMILVSDGFHQYRASLIAQKQGVGVGAVSARTPWYTLATFWMREIFALAQELILH